MIKSETYKTLHTPFLNAYKEYKKETGFTRDQVEDTDILETMGTAMLKILLIQMISLLDEEDISSAYPFCYRDSYHHPRKERPYLSGGPSLQNLIDKEFQKEIKILL